MVEPSLAERERCKHGVPYKILVQLTPEILKEHGHEDC